MDKYNRTRKDIVETAMRSTVFDATVNILKNEGLESLQMQRIAKQAGLSTGTLYNYFKDKDDLLIYVHDKLCSEFFDDLCKAADSDLTPDKKIIMLIRRVVNFVTQNRDIFEFLELSDVFRKAKEENKYDHRKQFIELFASVLQEGVNQKIFADIDAHKVSDMLHACLVGMFKVNSEFKNLPTRVDGEDMIKMFSAYLGISPD